MATVFDVAAYILEQRGPMTAMKLQKLVYYAQAWALVWDEAPLFDDRIEAWANGPVCPTLYNAHRGEFHIESEPRGDSSALRGYERETVDAILSKYGAKTASWLSALTHSEDPWIDARHGLADGERGNAAITHGAMTDYYGNL